MKNIKSYNISAEEEQNEVYWKEEIFPEFIFHAKDENYGYNIYIQVDNSATSKKFFGFMMCLFKKNNECSWHIAVNDSMGGSLATVASEVLAVKLIKILKSQKIDYDFRKNGVPSVKERITEWLLYHNHLPLLRIFISVIVIILLMTLAIKIAF